MTVHNLYVYHCSMDTFKTLKYTIPISLYSLYNYTYYQIEKKPCHLAVVPASAVVRMSPDC